MDSRAQVAHELARLAELQREYEEAGPSGLRCFVEPDPGRRHLVFHLVVDERTYVGRKLLEHTPGQPPRPTSRITPVMLLGALHSTLHTEADTRFVYRPLGAERKRALLREACETPGARLYFPYALLDAQGREAVPSSEFWRVTDALAAVLDRGEVHLREHTLETLRGLPLAPGALAWDPACSTGTFLGEVKRAFPFLRAVGSDLSPSMVERARPKLDEASVGDAREGAGPPACDLLFLRFLNAEVMTCLQAEVLFRALVRRVRPGGYVFVMGHTPVLPSVELLAGLEGLEVLRALGGRPGHEEVFQYYVLRRLTETGSTSGR
jgi:hypothetical protein